MIRDWYDFSRPGWSPPTNRSSCPGSGARTRQRRMRTRSACTKSFPEGKKQLLFPARRCQAFRHNRSLPRYLQSRLPVTTRLCTQELDHDQLFSRYTGFRLYGQRFCQPNQPIYAEKPNIRNILVHERLFGTLKFCPNSRNNLISDAHISGAECILVV